MEWPLPQYVYRRPPEHETEYGDTSNKGNYVMGSGLALQTARGSERYGATIERTFHYFSCSLLTKAAKLDHKRTFAYTRHCILLICLASEVLQRDQALDVF